MIIVFEGGDKAGKATQVKNTVEYLRKEHRFDVETLDFPQYESVFGKAIKSVLHGEVEGGAKLPGDALMYLFAYDRKLAAPIISSWLAKDKWVVLDRYVYSNIYSIATKTKRLFWNSKVRWLEKMEFEKFGLPRQDYNFYLYLPAEMSYALRYSGSKADESHTADQFEENLALQRRVSDMYKYLARRRPREWSFIDQIEDGRRLSADEVFERKIRPTVDKLYERWAIKNRRLWFGH